MTLQTCKHTHPCATQYTISDAKTFKHHTSIYCSHSDGRGVAVGCLGQEPYTTLTRTGVGLGFSVGRGVSSELCTVLCNDVCWSAGASARTTSAGPCAGAVCLVFKHLTPELHKAAAHVARWWTRGCLEPLIIQPVLDAQSVI